MKKIAIILLGLLSTPVITANAQVEKARATLMDADGRVAGKAYLTQTSEGVHIQLRLEHAPAGSHVLYVHQVGVCTPDLSAAGGHDAPAYGSHGDHHGADGHPGDPLDLHVDDTDGTVVADRTVTGVTLLEDAENSLLDADGAAIALHTAPDDHASQPAGSRIMCGVVERETLSQ